MDFTLRNVAAGKGSCFFKSVEEALQGDDNTPTRDTVLKAVKDGAHPIIRKMLDVYAGLPPQHLTDLSDLARYVIDCHVKGTPPRDDKLAELCLDQSQCATQFEVELVKHDLERRGIALVVLQGLRFNTESNHKTLRAILDNVAPDTPVLLLTLVHQHYMYFAPVYGDTRVGMAAHSTRTIFENIYSVVTGTSCVSPNPIPLAAQIRSLPGL